MLVALRAAAQEAQVPPVDWTRESGQAKVVRQVDFMTTCVGGRACKIRVEVSSDSGLCGPSDQAAGTCSNDIGWPV